MIIALLVLVALFAVSGFLIYKLQQKGNMVGGSISPAKSYWLSYALFNYLALSVLLLVYSPASLPFYFGLLVFVALIYLRSMVQMLMMYKFKNWRPPYGIFSNLLFAGVIIIFLITDYSSLNFSDWQLLVLPLFLIKITALLLCDTYYAFAFYRIVGDSTTGEQAIWFAASEDDRFTAINRLTFRLNILFSIFTLLLAVLILLVYG